MDKINYLYVLKNCKDSAAARKLLKETKVEYKTIVVDNPMLELGIMATCKGALYVPLLVHADKGIFVFNDEGKMFCVKELPKHEEEKSRIITL